MSLSFHDLLSNNLGLPTVERVSEVKVVDRTKNPIRVILADGTTLKFTIDEFKIIPGGEPVKGKKMKVVFQRHPNDSSKNESQIQACYVF